MKLSDLHKSMIRGDLFSGGANTVCAFCMKRLPLAPRLSIVIPNAHFAMTDTVTTLISLCAINLKKKGSASEPEKRKWNLIFLTLSNRIFPCLLQVSGGVGTVCPRIPSSGLNTVIITIIAYSLQEADGFDRIAIPF